ncbi:MAG: transposase zinc-binding domain-containing protein [Pseudomonadales bacterium]
MPRFIQADFEQYLRCGLLEHGFVRVKCDGCRHEHLVAFSYKKRGICPSCGARCMVETSVHLIDNVFPDVPIRQWVLTFPWPLRLLFARQPNVLSQCLAVINPALEMQLIQRAGLSRREHQPKSVYPPTRTANITIFIKSRDFSLWQHVRKRM